MDQLKLVHSLGVKSPAVISFFGAGGKTTLMYRLAEEIRSSGRKVLLTTTTKIKIPPELPFFINENTEKSIHALKEHFKNESIAVFGKRVLRDNKIEGIAAAEVQQFRDQLPVSILIEADGSRGMPIKGYAENEPVLPACSDLIAAVIGADALYIHISSDTVHRSVQFAAATGAGEDSIIIEKTVAAAFQHMLKLGRSQAPGAETVCILNKADLLKNPGSAAVQLSGLLSGQGSTPERFIITAGNDEDPVKVILNYKDGKQPADVSCVLLAAGTSSRMGEDKLSLPFNDNTILEHTLDQITESGIEDIIVVVRPDSSWQQKLGTGKYKLIENPLYYTGIASSLKAGLAEVSSRAQGVIFALADQPLVPPAIYRQLIDRYRSSLKLVTYPVYQGQKGNPTLFDRRTWPSLMLLSGDQGGRTLVSKMSEDEIDLIETVLPSVIADIDTPESYRMLIKNNNHRTE